MQNLQIVLTRENQSVPWGFRLKGGAEYNVPLSILKVTTHRPSQPHSAPTNPHSLPTDQPRVTGRRQTRVPRRRAEHRQLLRPLPQARRGSQYHPPLRVPPAASLQARVQRAARQPQLLAVLEPLAGARQQAGLRHREAQLQLQRLLSA
jgi:hypothetical protein